jgi:hypothetical protein
MEHIIVYELGIAVWYCCVVAEDRVKLIQFESDRKIMSSSSIRLRFASEQTESIFKNTVPYVVS